MKRLTLLLRWLKVRMHRANVLSFTGILVLLTAIVSMAISGIFEFIPNVQFYPNPEDRHAPFWSLALMAVVVAPLLETMLYQALPHLVAQRADLLRPGRRWVVIVLSGLMFGASHYYSLHYIVAATALGALMMWGYIVRYQRHPYWSLVVFHACWNALALLLHHSGLDF